MKKQKLVILTGAGMSAESGISTFRDSNGLWENYAIEDVATPQAWFKDPDLVTQFYNIRRKQVIAAQPNKAHIFLSELENYWDVEIITQNIDDLHERAGSSKILHLHGNIRLAKSSGPQQEAKYYPIKGWELTNIDTCDDGYRLRPHVVWFGESVPLLSEAEKLVEQADVFMVIGTSLNVYPAANLAHYANRARLKIVIDPNATELHLNASFLKINHTAVGAIEQLKDLLLPQ